MTNGHACHRVQGLQGHTGAQVYTHHIPLAAAVTLGLRPQGTYVICNLAVDTLSIFSYTVF
jgi:hypothetical protein